MQLITDIAADLAKHPVVLVVLLSFFAINRLTDGLERRETTGRIIERFPRVSTIGLVVIVGAGLINAAVYLIEFAANLL